MSQPQRMLDIICLGRAGVDLYGEQIGAPLKDVSSFRKYVGGSPCNVAIGSARLNLKSAMITRLGQDDLGTFVEEQLNREGVNTQFVSRDPHRLTGLVVLGIEDKETFPLIFYREACADMYIEETQVNQAFIAKSKALLLSGTHLSTAESFKVSALAAKYAQDVGTQVILDIDYRPTLWGLNAKGDGETRFIPSKDVTETLQAFLPTVDLVVGTEEEFYIAAGTTDLKTAIKIIRRLTQAPLVLKRGAQGACLYLEDLEKPIESEGFPVEVMNVLGAGDAFLSGFLKGWLTQQSFEKCLKLGNACGAIVVSRHGCSPAMPSEIELDLYLSMQNKPLVPDTLPVLARTHRATTTAKPSKPLMLAALDHRIPSALCKRYNLSREQRLNAQALLFKSLLNSDLYECTFGLLLEAEQSQALIQPRTQHIPWVGLSVEIAESKPLEFYFSEHLYHKIVQTPSSYTIKCSVNYHPDDLYSLKHQQEEQLLKLYYACLDSDHELMIEINIEGSQTITPKTFAKILERFYEVGIYANWWQLPPLKASAWQHIESVIQTYDPLCRGIIVLAQNGSLQQFISTFEQLRPFQSIQGLCLGRPLFWEPLNKWFLGQLQDNEFSNMIQQNFKQVYQSWLESNVSMTATHD